MLQNKMPKGTLLLAGLAAFAYYKYSKMSPDQKSNLAGSIKEKGRKLYDQYVPDELKNMFEKKEGNTFTNNFSETSEFVS